MKNNDVNENLNIIPNEEIQGQEANANKETDLLNEDNKPKKKKEFSWYVYLILAVSCFLFFYTIFFYLFCFVF